MHETRAVEAGASERDIRGALLATLRDRLEVCRPYITRDTPEDLQERYTVLTFGLDSAHGRGTEELRRLHASAGRLIEALAHDGDNFGGGGVDGDTQRGLDTRASSPDVDATDRSTRKRQAAPREGSPVRGARRNSTAGRTGKVHEYRCREPQPGQNRPATNLCPGCDGDPAHPGVTPCPDCHTVCVHDDGCHESAAACAARNARDDAADRARHAWEDKR